MLYVLGCGSVVEGDDGQTAGHGFKSHVAESLGQTGEKKEVAGGVVRRQILAMASAGKDSIGKLAA